MKNNFCKCNVKNVPESTISPSLEEVNELLKQCGKMLGINYVPEEEREKTPKEMQELKEIEEMEELDKWLEKHRKNW